MSSADDIAVEPAAAFGQPLQRVVMKHHGFAVGGKLQVALDRVVAGDGGRKGCGRVLDHAGRRIVQAAVRDRSRDQPIEASAPLPKFVSHRCTL